MKRGIILLVSLVLFSCTKENVQDLPIDNTKSTFVTEAMAIAQVEEFVNKLDVDTKGISKEIVSIYSTGKAEHTKSNNNDVQSPFVYVVNFANDMGFALVSGDTRMPPILAMVDNGNLAEGTIIDDPCVASILSNIDVEYRLTTGMPVENPNGGLDFPIGISDDGTYVYPLGLDTAYTQPDNPFEPLDITYEYTEWQDYKRKGSVLECEWGQSPLPYNKYTFAENGVRTPAGCVAAAVAQIMYYWGNNVTLEGYTFDWNLMRKHKSNSQSYPLAHDMIGMLYLKLGIPENLDMSYNITGSGAYDSNVPRTFENFGYTSGGQNESYDYDLLYEKIGEGPAYISGYSHQTTKTFLGITVRIEYEGGHAWVIDEILEQRRQCIKYINGEKKSTQMQSRRLVHCNFGWNGSFNGYYYSANFNTNEGPVLKSTNESNNQESGYYQYLLNMNRSIRK